MRQKKSIEDLLRWTFRDELPKDREGGRAAFLPPGGHGHAWGSVTAYGELLATIDDGGYNRWGVVPFGASVRGEPHPDALAVANAVIDLEELVLDLPPDWEPLGDLIRPDLPAELLAPALEAAILRITQADALGERRLSLSLRRLVFRYAILGGCPVWEADAPEVKLVSSHGKAKWFVMRRVAIGEDAFGEPIYEDRECDGYSATAKRPVAGAYQKRVLEPDPTDAAVARAEYELWRAALDVLVEDLHPVLTTFEPTASPRPMRPWEAGAAPPGRVLPDLSVARATG